MILYKYKDLTEPAHVLSILRGRLFCASPNIVNDPNEFKFTVDYRINQQTFVVLDSIRKNSGHGFNISVLGDNFPMKSALELDMVIRPLFEDLVLQIRRDLGIASFAKDSNSSQLWERYAGDGDGVCVEISLRNEDNVRRVDYEDDRRIHMNSILASLVDAGARKNLYEKILLTKTTCWQTENEMRYISKVGNVELSFDMNITKLTIGQKVSEQDEQLLRATIQNTFPSAVVVKQQKQRNG